MARDGFLLEGETGGIHSVVISFFVVLRMDSVFAKTIFWGKDFAKPRLIFFLHFVRAEEGSGEESARAFCSDFLAESKEKISRVWDLCAKIKVYDLI